MIHNVDQGSESFEKTLTLVGVGGGKKVFEIIGLEARWPRRGVGLERKRSRLDHFLRYSDSVWNLA